MVKILLEMGLGVEVLVLEFLQFLPHYEEERDRMPEVVVSLIFINKYFIYMPSKDSFEPRHQGLGLKYRKTTYLEH